MTQPTPLDPANQAHWGAIVDASIYELASVGRVYGIDAGQLSRYIRGLSTPQTKTLERVTKIMTDLTKKPKLVKHPSFGYATPDEIEKITTMGICPQRDHILATIKKRNETKGKTKA